MTYGCLLDDNVLDEEVLEIKVFRVRVRLGVLEEAEDELDRLLGPAAWQRTSARYRSAEGNDGPWVALNCFAWLARPTPPLKRRKGMTCL